MKPIFLILTFNFFLLAFPQSTIQIKDFDTGQPVQKARVYKHANRALLGSTDSQGFLTINDENIEKETFYIEAEGYLSRFDHISEGTKTIFLESGVQIKNNRLNAENLIIGMIQKEKINHPHSLHNYKYSSYTKFEIDADSLSMSYIENPEKRKDRINNKVKKALKNNMFFLAERSMDHLFDEKLGEKNIITANKISGIQKPVYEILAKELRRNELPEFLEIKNLKFYRFRLLDSLTLHDKKTYKISFYLTRQYNKNTSSSGTLYIDAESLALVRYIGSIKNQWLYEYNVERESRTGVWMTSREFIRIIFPLTRILNKNTTGTQSWATISTLYSGFTYPVTFSKEEFFGYEYEVSKDFWNNEARLEKVRQPALTLRESQTYSAIDSVAHNYHLIKKMQFLSPLLLGEVRMNKVNMDLFNSIRFNDFEGLRFQLGGRTNYDFSKDISLKGYTAWAAKDQQLKYGAGIDFFVNKINNGKFSLLGESDVNAAGKNRFREYGAIENVRDQTNNLSNNIYYRYKKGELQYQQDFFDYFTASLVTDYQTQKSLFDYSYKDNLVSKEYHQFASSLRIKFTPFVKYMKTPINKIAIEDEMPYFFFNYTRSWKAFSSDFEYDKFDFTTFFNLKNRWGNTKITANAGFISGKTSLFNLYEGFGVVKNGDNILKRFELKGYNTFETIHPGSFFASKYVAFFITHTFKDLRVWGNKYLYMTLVYNGMIGNMEHKELHTLHSYTVPDKYYQEVGIEFNKLISIFGLGAYYRLGSYHSGNFEDNLYIKLTYTLFK
ncbi:DUF5686 family protein [Apibacter sp. HY039]|uniref:DUF5686 family protein n=1 Tax=Apibacter sp. HY039 TaxID=2501476 RepID=UPI000FEC0754|nr:DUF5686 family protein [Apibacter sp. HY039]